MPPVGENIRLARIRKKLSQQNMADELNITQAAYSKLERDETKMDIDRIYEIAEILEMSPFDLMPKPKYGLSINLNFLEGLPNRLRNLWKRLRGRPVDIELSEIPNPLE